MIGFHSVKMILKIYKRWRLRKQGDCYNCKDKKSMVFFNVLLIDKMWVWEVKGRNDHLKNHLIFFNIVGIVIINAI